MAQDLQDLMGLDPKDLAQRIIQKQRGLGQGQVPGVSVSAVKPGKDTTDFTDLNSKEIARRIKKKYALPERKAIENIADAPFDIKMPESTGKDFFHEAQAQRNARESFFDKMEAEEKATRDAAAAANPNAPTESPDAYKGQVTWDKNGNIIPFTGPPGERVATIGPANTRQQLELGIPETQEEKDYWSSRVLQRDAAQFEPTKVEKFFDFFAQPLTHGANMYGAGIPAMVNKAIFGEGLPEPLTAGAGVTGGLGSLAGLIGPGKFTVGAAKGMSVANRILGKSFIPTSVINRTGYLLRDATAPADILHAIGKAATSWKTTTAGGEMLKRMMSSTISMAGIYALGENEGENVGEIMLNKLKAMPSGALAGQVFGLAGLARFSKLHPATGWAIRAGATSLALDLLHDQSPWDERKLWEKVYGYSMNAWFTRPGTAMSPRDIQLKLEVDSRVQRMTKEADAVDKEMAKDGLKPVAKQSLKKAVKEHAEKLGAESTATLPTKEGEGTLIQKVKAGTPAAKAAKSENSAKVQKAVEKAKIVFKEIEGDKPEVPANPVEGQTARQAQAAELQDMLLKASDTLAEPGKMSAAKKAELQDLLWEVHDALALEKAENDRMARGGGTTEQTRANLEAARRAQPILNAEGQRVGTQVRDGADLDLLEQKLPERRKNPALRKVFSRVLAGKGSEEDYAAVEDYNRRKLEGELEEGEEATLTELLKIDAMTGVPRKEVFFLDGGPKGKKFWAIDLKRMSALNDAIGYENVSHYLTRFGGIVRKSLPTGLKVVRWGGDEFLFYLDRPYGDRMTEKVNKYMEDLLTSLRTDGPLDGRWVYGSTAAEAIEKTNAAKRAEGKAPLPPGFDPSKYQPRDKPSPVAVAAKMNEAPSSAKTAKRTKTIVKTKEDGSVEITSKAEDDIPEIDVTKELKSTLLDIIKNPDKYDDALVGAAARELQRRGKLPSDFYSNENVRNRAFESLRQEREEDVPDTESQVRQETMAEPPGAAAEADRQKAKARRQEKKAAREQELRDANKRGTGPVDISKMSDRQIATLDVMDFSVGPKRDFIIVERMKAARRIILGLKEGDTLVDADGEELEVIGNSEGYVSWAQKSNRKRVGGGSLSDVEGWFIKGGEFAGQDPRVKSSARVRTADEPEFPTPREKFESEELRGQRTEERKRLKGLYVGKTWNAQNIIDYFMREEGLDKNAAKKEGRKAYKRYEGGKHKWESLINFTTRRRFGGGGEQGGAPAAPAAPATPVSQVPPVSPTGAGAKAFPTRSGEVIPKRPVAEKPVPMSQRKILERGTAETARVTKDVLDRQQEVLRQSRERDAKQEIAGKSDAQLRKELAARYYANSGKMPSKESLDRAVKSIREGGQKFPERGPEKTREEEVLESDVDEVRKPEPPKPQFKPGETIQDNEGETWWGPLRDGGVPAEFEALKEGDIWIRQGRGRQPRAKISKVDSELPWNAEVLYQGDTAVVNTNVYDLWARGFRPKGFKGGDTIGRIEAPRPAMSVMGPEDSGVRERPAGAPKRSSDVVLDKQQKLEAARETERILRARRQAKAGIPAEEPTPEPIRGGTIRKGDSFPTAGIRSIKTAAPKEGEDIGESARDVPFANIKQARLTRTYDDLYQDVLKDPRYQKDAERVVDILQDAIEKWIPAGRKDPAGYTINENVLEDIRDKVHDMFVQNFDPSESKSATLKDAVERYINMTTRGEIPRGAIESLKEGQFKEGEEGLDSQENMLTQDQMIFELTSQPLNKPDEIKTNQEIWAEEDARVERNGTERQRLAKQAVLDVRKAIPIEDQGLFNEFVSQMVLMPEDQQLSLRRMAEELGVNRETLRRHIDAIKKSIEDTVMNNPEYYDAFVKEARSVKDYWDEMAQQGKEDRLNRAEERLAEARREMGDPQGVDEIVRAAEEYAEELLNPKPKPFYKVRAGVPRPTEFAQQPENVKLVEPDLSLPRPGEELSEEVKQSRLMHAIGEIVSPKARIVADPWFFEATDAVEKFMDIKFENIRKGWAGFSDLGRMPFWNEKMKNVSNAMLDMEGVGSRITEGLFKTSKPFFTMSKAEKGRVLQVLELEDMAESLVTNPNSLAAIRMRQAGIALTTREKQGYRAMRKAFDQVLLKEMPKLMRGAGFSQQEIMDITGRYYRDGYMPHFRYGDYVLSYLFPVKGVHGVRYRRFVESYETENERAKARAKLPQSFRTSQGRKAVRFTEFKFSDVRLDPNSFVQILEHWPVAERMFKKQAITEGEKRAVDIVEKLAKESILGNYAKGRFAQRRGRMGWSKDYERAIKDYFTHVPFSMARRYMRGGLEAEIDKLTSARDKDYARDLYKFWSGGGTREGKPTMYTRKLIYDYYLMFKPSFMLQNLTQRMTTHLPLAIAEAQILQDAGRGTIGGTKASLIAQKLELDIYGRTLARLGSGREMSVESVIRDHPGLSRKESKVLLQLFDSGELGALRTKESVGRSFAQVGVGSKGILKYIPSPEAFGIISERSNRLHSALTALKIFEGEGYTHNEMYKKVTDFIRKADFPYSKATRQKMARGFFGSNAFVFKSYLQNYVFGLMPYMYKNSKPAALTASAMFVALAGAMGIPGYNLMRAGVKALLPGNYLDKEKKMADLEDKFDESFAGIFAHGIPAIAGIDGSSWFGFPDLLKLVPVSFSENIKNNLVTRLTDKDASVDTREVLTRLAPSYAKHWLRADQMEKTGSISTDRYGAPTLTPQDINRFPREVKDWAFEQYNKLPTPDDMSDLEKAMYREVGAPSLQASRYYNKVDRLRRVNERVKKEKGSGNRTLANMFVENVTSDDEISRLQMMREGNFKREFWNIVHTWPEDAQQELRDIIDEQAEEGIAFDLGAILNAIQERVQAMRRRND